MKDNINYTDILDDDIENEEYLEEANDSKSVKSYICLLFGHLLKFIYQKTYQSNSWIRTIRDSNNDIIGILSNKTEYNRITDKVLDDQYRLGIERYANKQAHLGMNPNSPRPKEWDRDFIMNKEVIKNLLLYHANSDKVKEDIIYEFDKK